jgi:Domain of unknown function (DUF4082)
LDFRTLAAATISVNVATGVAEGTSIITATLNGISGSTNLTVSSTAPPPPPPPPNIYSLFKDTDVPAVPNFNPAMEFEAGLRFTSDVNGFVTGVRFYKDASNNGSHVGSLWSANGQLLAQVTFTNETASGWQQADFSSPVAIAPHTEYVISRRQRLHEFDKPARG